MIKFAAPQVGQEEIDAVTAVLRSGWIASGEVVKKFEEDFARYVGARHAIFTNGCTSALKLALKALGGYPGGIVVPSFTFTATAAVVVETGNKPLFADIIIPELTLDPNDMARRYHDGVKAVIPVNYGGNVAWNHYPGTVIVDSAHLIDENGFLDGREDNKILAQCYSFYATKNMTTGTGGMLVTNNDDFAKKVRTFNNDGLSVTARDRYTTSTSLYEVEEIGGGYDSNDILAAIGIEQLKKLPQMNLRREQIVHQYNEAFGENWQGFHLYPILVNNRDGFMEFMKQAGIPTSVHYRPLHQMSAYRKYAGTSDLFPELYDLKLPVTEWVGERVVSLPLHPGLSDADVKLIVKKVKEWRKISE